MNAKSLLWGLTLFVLSLQQMHAQFTVGSLDRDAYKYWLVDDKYTKDWNVYFAEQEYSGKKVQCGILADSVVTGKTYQVIERTGVDMTADTLLYRQEGKKVFRHTENDGTDILLFDFGLNEGDEFVTHDGETWIVADIDEEYQNWDNTNRKFVLTGKEDGEQKDVWVEDVGSLYTGILTRADLPPTNTPRLLYCRQIEMTSWRFDVNLPSYDAVFFLDGDFRNEEDLYFFESLLMDNSLDGDSLFVEFIGDSLRLYGIMEINMYVYLMESREQDGIINLNRTDVHFGDEYLGHARRWIDIVIPGFEEGEYEVVYEGKSLGKYTCKGKKQSVSMFDGNPQWVYVHHYLLADAGYYEMGTNKTVYSFYKYYVEGADVINNKTYHRLYADYVDNLVIDIEDDQYKKLEPEFSDSSYTHKFVCHLREENGCVYGIKSEMDYLSVFNPYTITDGDEVVLYDFNNWHIGYEQPIYHNWTEKLGMTWKINDIAERVMMDNSVRTVLNINDIEHIEGVGPLEVSFVYNPISNPLTSGYTGDYYLNVFVQNDNIVYRAPLPDEATDKEGSQYGVYREDPFLTEDNQSSGIEEITTNTTNSRTDNALYDLMGRRLNGVPAKGIYIQNGKKYVR